MTAIAAWSLVGLGLATATVRRRSLAIPLVAAQSLVLGAVALSEGWGDSRGLAVAGVVLALKGLALPLLLADTVRRTREAALPPSDGTALGRLAAAATLAGAAAALTPSLGLTPAVAGHAAVALVALGAGIAVLRGGAVFQALGFMVAENGVYLAALTAAGGLSLLVELGVAIDLALVVAVAAAFSSKLHGHHGTADTTGLRVLRD